VNRSSLPVIDDYISTEPPVTEPIDDVFARIFESYGMPRLGGASGRGWSSYAALQRCMYLYKMRYVVEGRVRGRAPRYLDMGSTVHTLLALHYLQMMTPGPLTPDVLREELLASNVSAQMVMDSWRLYEAYASYYDNDYLTPLAVERLAEGDEGVTCRYDLLARVEEARPGVVPGVFVCEHKTSSRFDQSTLEGWKNDGEVIGQIMVYQQANLAEIYGPLQGVIVNILGKQKVPQFTRVVVPVQAWQSEAHAHDLRMWRALEQMARVTNAWPRSRAGCVGRYGLCELFDHCAGDGGQREET